MLLDIPEPLFTKIYKGGQLSSQRDGGRTRREKCSDTPVRKCKNAGALKTRHFISRESGLCLLQALHVLLPLRTLMAFGEASTTTRGFLGSLKDFKYAQIFRATPTSTQSHNPSPYRWDVWFGRIMFAYEKQKVCSCCGGGGGGGGREGGGFFLVYVIGLNDPRPRLDENRRVRQCVWREKEGEEREKIKRWNS